MRTLYAYPQIASSGPGWQTLEFCLNLLGTHRYSCLVDSMPMRQPFPTFFTTYTIDFPSRGTFFREQKGF